MSTKNISISEDAYELLNDLREGDESYSDVIRRLAGRNDDLVRFSGAFPEIDAVADELEAERKGFETREVEEP